jgi:putative flavoprotein involved in K+ transport
METEVGEPRNAPHKGGFAPTPMESVAVAIVGGGQAGLATSRELTKAGLEHVVLERGRVGETWRNRWDSLCLVTPNWSVQLPDGHYAGPEPDGFMPRDEFVTYLERYAAQSQVPIREHVDLRSVESLPGDGFVLRTSAGDTHAKAVVLATGAYQRPHRPAAAATLPAELAQIDVDDYRNEQTLPPGKVLIIGSGQSGCQIAEELSEAGRDVVVACGRAPWAPRRFGGRDLLWWAQETGFLDWRLDSLPAPEARLFGALVTGNGRGPDLHLRTLQARGVTLAGHFLGATDRKALFAPDLDQSVAWGDERYLQFRGLVDNLVSTRGLKPAALDDPEPFTSSPPNSIDLAHIGSVIFAAGFRPDYRSWLPWPDAFDTWGFPLTQDGASTVVPGLYFVGVHFMRKRKSSLLIGVGEDAAIVAQQITEAYSTVRSTSSVGTSGMRAS